MGKQDQWRAFDAFQPKLPAEVRAQTTTETMVDGNRPITGVYRIRFYAPPCAYCTSDRQQRLFCAALTVSSPSVNSRRIAYAHHRHSFSAHLDNSYPHRGLGHLEFRLAAMPRPSRRIVLGQSPAPFASASRSGSGSGSSGGAVSQPASRSVSASSAGTGAGASGYDLSSSTSSLASSSGSSVSPVPSPAKNQMDRSISQYEVLYNTAVQSFVRRDHAKAHATLSKLLDLLAKERVQSGSTTQTAWWDLSPSPDTLESSHPVTPLPSSTSIDEWTIRSLKLLISSLASLYADPSPSRRSTLPDTISSLLPPTPADRILTHLHAQCVTHAVPPPPAGPDGSRLPYNPASSLLPPALLSTLLLAALKIPGETSVEWAHRLAEDWIGALPEAFFGAIASPARRQGQGQGNTGGAQSGQMELQKLEAAREGYIKVVELFVGEILVREGEWEMARAFLEGESVIGSKRKEASLSLIPPSQSPV